MRYDTKYNIKYKIQCLQITYNDKRLSFEDLSKKDNSVTIYQNLHDLTTGMFKIYNKTSPDIMQEIFPIKEEGQ